jgi:hypothetical protein
MDLFQLRSCTAVLVALEDFDVILEVQLFKQPDDSLSARLLEPEESLACCEELGARPVASAALLMSMRKMVQ